MNDDTVVDDTGRTCSDYYDRMWESACGLYDSDTFVAADACCACKDDGDPFTYTTDEAGYWNAIFYLMGVAATSLLILFLPNSYGFLGYAYAKLYQDSEIEPNVQQLFGLIFLISEFLAAFTYITMEANG